MATSFDLKTELENKVKECSHNEIFHIVVNFSRRVQKLS